jgi:hypothetical protein
VHESIRASIDGVERFSTTSNSAVVRAMPSALHNTHHAVTKDFSGLVTIRVDHVGDDGAAEWVYRLVPVRWSHTDPELLLGVWPD